MCAHRDWSSNYRAYMGPHQALCLYSMLWLLARWFCGTPNNRSVCDSDSFAWSWNSCPSVGLPWYEVFYLVLVYLVLSCLAVFSWMPALFWRLNKGGVGLEERSEVNWESWRERKLVGMYCIRDKPIFHKRRSYSLKILRISLGVWI